LSSVSHSAVPSTVRNRPGSATASVPLGGELHVGGDPRLGAAGGVVGPAAGRVRLAVDQGVPRARRGTRGGPRPASSPCVRRCRCTGAAPRWSGALLHVPCLVQGQGCPRAAETVAGESEQVGGDTGVVPARTAEEVLQNVRVAVLEVLGDRPAVLRRQPRGQTGDEPAHRPTGLRPRSPPAACPTSSLSSFASASGAMLGAAATVGSVVLHTSSTESHGGRALLTPRHTPCHSRIRRHDHALQLEYQLTT
jgi:hypothetical protein